jgi:hypothetical protein
MITGRMIAAQKLNEPAQKKMLSEAPNSIDRSDIKEQLTEIDDVMWGHIKTAVDKDDRNMVWKVMHPLLKMKNDASDVESDIKQLSKRSTSMQG